MKFLSFFLFCFLIVQLTAKPSRVPDTEGLAPISQSVDCQSFDCIDKQSDFINSFGRHKRQEDGDSDDEEEEEEDRFARVFEDSLGNSRNKRQATDEDDYNNDGDLSNVMGNENVVFPTDINYQRRNKRYATEEENQDDETDSEY
jgi:hypothetical protein